MQDMNFEQAMERLDLPVIESKCPANEKTKREDAKLLLQRLSDPTRGRRW